MATLTKKKMKKGGKASMKDTLSEAVTLSAEQPDKEQLCISPTSQFPIRSNEIEIVQIAPTSGNQTEIIDPLLQLDNEEVEETKEITSSSLVPLCECNDEFISKKDNEMKTENELCDTHKNMAFYSGNIIENTTNLIKDMDLSKAKEDVEKLHAIVKRELFQEVFVVREMLPAYYKELYEAQVIEENFLREALGNSPFNTELYTLLDKYRETRVKITNLLIDIPALKKQIDSSSGLVWKIRKEVKEVLGKCGDNRLAKGSVEFNSANIDTTDWDIFSNLQVKLKELVFRDFLVNLFQAKELAIQIETVIDDTISKYAACKFAVNLALTEEIYPHSRYLRASISTCFFFIRKPCQDTVFIANVKSWLLKLAALQLKIGTKEDYFFLLFHLLRCPNGISWGISMVQIPQYTEFSVQFCISLLKVILSPIQKREEFLKALAEAHSGLSGPSKEDIWLLIDSDGEEGNTFSNGLKEKDMIALLQQIPFEKLFCEVLKIQKLNEIYSIQQEHITKNSLLAALAFNTVLVEMLGEGIRNYGDERYRQFAKRLGLLLKHSINYSTYFYHLFMRNSVYKDAQTCERIHSEFETFVLISCKSLYQSRSLGMWQYFNSLPYQIFQSKTIWKIFYFLNVGFINDTSKDLDYLNILKEDQFRICCNTNLDGISDEDFHYLLQTFLGMALSRSMETDKDFIQTVCCHVFYVGFINETTSHFYKSCRDILATLTSKYPNLISVLVNALRPISIEVNNFEYLYSYLPLEEWIPDLKCVDLLSTWLLNYSCDSRESHFARFLIDHLNWGINFDNELFLPYNIHVRMAYIICEAANRHTKEAPSGLSNTVAQISNLIASRSPEECFLDWCWRIIFSLRLHHLDQNVSTSKLMLNSPSSVLLAIPDLNDVGVIWEGVVARRSLSIFTGILSTLWGHSIPLICQKGFEQMEILLDDNKQLLVIRCLQLISVLFVETPETLYNCERFKSIIDKLLNSDNTYVNLAKNILFYNFDSSVIDLFGKMIQAQILNYNEYGLSSPVPLMKLWLQCFLRIPSWQNTNACHIVEILLKTSYPFVNSWTQAKTHFQNMLRISGRITQQSSSFHKLFAGNSKSMYTFPWLALMLTEAEFVTFELETNLWVELLKQYKTDSNKALDTALKEAVQITKSAPFQPQELAIFKFAGIISNLDPKNVLLPILSQQFFILYLARISLQPDNLRSQRNFGLSNIFYGFNTYLMENVRKVLCSANEYYQRKMQMSAKECDQVSNRFYCDIHRLFTACLLWLNDTSLNHIPGSSYINLPPQYYPEKLFEIFFQNAEHWTSFLKMSDLLTDSQNSAKCWLHYFRPKEHKNIRSNPIAEKKIDIIERITCNLKSYDKPCDGPELNLNDILIENETAIIIRCHNILKDWESDSKILRDASRYIEKLLKETDMLDENFKNVLKTLYKNETYSEVRKVKCSSSLTKPFSSCTKAGEVSVLLERPKKDLTVQRQIECLQHRYDELIKIVIFSDFDEINSTIKRIHYLIEHLNAVFDQNNQSNLSSSSMELYESATNAFYKLIKSYDNVIFSCIPINKIWRNLINILKYFVERKMNTEGVRIMELILQSPDLADILEDMINPLVFNTSCFVHVYKLVIDSSVKVNTALWILSKFHLDQWLRNTQLAFDDIAALLKVILGGMAKRQSEENLLLALRQHFVIVFEFSCPGYCENVLQLILNSCSKEEIDPGVIIDAVNSILLHSSAQLIDCRLENDLIYPQISVFSREQKLFSFQAIVDIMRMLQRHFKSQRMKFIFHGLYPKYAKYCVAISVLLAAFGHAAVMSAILTYPNEPIKEVCKWVFIPIVNMYEPWVIVYDESNTEGTENILREIYSSGRVLYPWSEIYTESSRTMIDSLTKCFQFLIDNLAVPNVSLEYIFDWYHRYFIKDTVPSHICNTINENLSSLKWQHYYPPPMHLEMFCEILAKDAPENHTFIATIFMKILWKNWFTEVFSSWNLETQNNSIDLLFTVFMKISFQSNIYDKPQTYDILSSSLIYPWSNVSSHCIEHVFDWLQISKESTIILNLAELQTNTAVAALRLLELASGFTAKDIQNNSYTHRNKRAHYIRASLHMLKLCNIKHGATLQNAAHLSSFKAAIIKLLSCVEKVASFDANQENCQNLEIANLLLNFLDIFNDEVDYIDRIAIDTITAHQSNKQSSSALTINLLDAISVTKHFGNHMYILLEITLQHYFMLTDQSKVKASWKIAMNRLGRVFMQIDLKELIQNDCLLCLNAFIIYNINSLDRGRRSNFLNNVIHSLQSAVIRHDFERYLVLAWLTISSVCCNFFITDHEIQKTTLLLANYFKVTSMESTGFTTGILTIMRIRRHSYSEKYKILMKCLSCLLFSLPTDTMQKSDEMLTQIKTLTNLVQYDIKTLVNSAIETIENCISQKSLVIDAIVEVVCLFYSNSVVYNIEDVWIIE